MGSYLSIYTLPFSIIILLFVIAGVIVVMCGFMLLHTMLQVKRKSDSKHAEESPPDFISPLPLEENLALVAVGLGKLIPCETIVIYALKENSLIPEYISGKNCHLFSSLHIPLGAGLCGWVAQNKQYIINGDPATEAGFASELSDAATPRSMLAVPLEGTAGLVGVLALYQSKPDAFTSEHLQALPVIASCVALFIENALKYREAKSSASSDYLTGMANARALSIHLKQRLSLCRQDESTIAVMLCDFNGFKQINDRYGHLTGDKVLKLFASMVRKACRETDYAARIGGDEFVIIAPGMPPASVAERALVFSSLARQACQQICHEDFLSLALGAAFYPQDGITSEQLLTVADNNMYAAKRQYYESNDTILAK